LLFEDLCRYGEYLGFIYIFSIHISDIADHLSVTDPIGERFSYEIKKLLSVREESSDRELCSQEYKFVFRHVSEFFHERSVVQ